MNQTPKNALDILKFFLISDLVERDFEKALSCLSKDVEWYGMTNQLTTRDFAEAAENLRMEMRDNPIPYGLEIEEESIKSFGEYAGAAMIKGIISSEGVTAKYRITASACVEDGKWKLSTIHISVPAMTKGDGGFFPFSISNDYEKKIRYEVLNAAINGGMMGGYIEEKLPLYFINDNMLQYLGYESEKEFREATDGYIDNCIHPDDRDFVNSELKKQLANKNEYSLMHRMLKKDGNFIWVDNKGKVITVENGKQSLISVYLDITLQKESEFKLIENATLYKLAIENSDVNMWKFDINTGTLYQTERSKKSYPGIDIEIPNFVNMMVEKGYVRQDSIEDFLDIHRRISEGESEVGGDLWFTNANKQWRCERVVYTLVKDNKGNVMYAVGIGRNITEEIQALMDKKQMELALSSTSIALWTYDIEKGIFKGRNNGSRSLGLSKSGSKGYRGIIDNSFVMPESINDFIELHKALERGEKSAVATIHYDKSKIKVEWQKISYLTIFDKNKKPILGVAVGEDVSALINAQKRYEEEIRSQEALQEKVLFGKIRANLTKNILEEYTSSNEKYRIKNTIKTHDAIINDIASLCIDSDYSNNFKSTMAIDNLTRKFAEGEQDIRIEYQRRINDGSVKWVRSIARTYLDPATGDVMCFMYAFDIDQERTMQAIVTRLIDVEFEAMALIGIESGKYRFIRQSSLEDRIGVHLDNDYNEKLKEFVDKFIIEECRDKAIYQMNMEMLCSQLEKAPSYTCAFNLDIDGNKYRKKWEYVYLDDKCKVIMYVRTDITALFKEQELQRQNLKIALIQAQQASVAKTEFLSRMSHEIRTPMNAILGMSAIGAQCIDEPNKVADCISKVSISAKYLLTLINDILDMSRIESGKVTVRNDKIPFEEFIGGINTISFELAKSKGVEYDCIVTSFIESFYMGDPMKLQQVIVNIISNAIKFTNAGGNVQFIINQVRTENGKAHMRFIVNDTGIGISDEFLKKIFEPFEQAHSGSTNPYGGTGLGLAISKNLVDIMNGKISITSIEGVGTEFTVDIPLGVCDDQKQFSKLQHDRDWSKISALIVDDEITVCEHTDRILKEIGIKSEWVDSGLKASKKVEEKWIQKDHYDLILTDWRMPDIDGIETTKRIRSIVGTDTTIIMMTSYDWAFIEIEAKKAGVNVVISKPLFKASLYSALEKIYFKNEKNSQQKKTIEFDFTGKRVLIVEDHLINIEIAKRLLTLKGCEVEIANNGLMAIETFMLVPDNYFDAILMDIRMPIMDGLTAAKSIRQLRKQSAKTIPIIAMSANAFEEDADKSKEAGMNAHLTKPIEPNTLYATVHSFIKK